MKVRLISLVLLALLVATVAWFQFEELQELLQTIRSAPPSDEEQCSLEAAQNALMRDAAGHGVFGKEWKATRRREFASEYRIYSGSSELRDVHRDAFERSMPACERWAVITTIFAPSPLAHQLASLDSWCTVVIGDEKTPNSTWVEAFAASDRLVYLDIATQQRLPYAIVPLTPHNHFSRKNIGFMFAIHHGARVIYDTDDDNMLQVAGGDDLHEWSECLLSDESRTLRQFDTNVLVLNPYVYFNFSVHDGTRFGSRTVVAWPRGFPLESLPDVSAYRLTTSSSTTTTCASIGIIQALANNDPDVDAIYRLTRSLPATFEASGRAPIAVPPRTFAPFNCQATMVSHKLFYAMMLPKTVHSRVADIWRSYFMQATMARRRVQVAFAPPWVRHERTPHSYLADFDGEHALYERSGELLRHLNEWREGVRNATSAWTEAAEQETLLIDMYEHGVVELDDVLYAQAWLHDLKLIKSTVN